MKKIEAFETTDGRVHKTKKEALLIQRLIDIDSWDNTDLPLNVTKRGLLNWVAINQVNIETLIAEIRSNHDDNKNSKQG